MKYAGTVTVLCAALAACSDGGVTGPTTAANRGDLAPSFAAERTIGTPGAPNCHGQTAAFFAQSAKREEVPEGFSGLGGLGRFAEVSVGDIQAFIRDYCSQVEHPPT